MSARQPKKGNKIIEGKTTIVFENQENPHTVIIQFKDDVTTAGGTRRPVLPSKVEIDATTYANVFEFLNKKKIPTHFLEQLNKNSFLATKLSYRFPITAVTRRVAYGSILERSHINGGDQFRLPLTELFYRDSTLHDPKLDDVQKDPEGYFLKMRMLNGKVFSLLEKAFRHQSYQLVDLKLEYGIAAQDNELVVVDEVTARTLRLWPFRKENPDFSRDNLLGQLDPEGKLDSDLYREGKPLGLVRERLKKLAKLTEKL